MTTLARRFSRIPWINKSQVLLENLAVEKDQYYEQEQTAYIFEDGSAIILGNTGYMKVVTSYGLSADNEQL